MSSKSSDNNVRWEKLEFVNPVQPRKRRIVFAKRKKKEHNFNDYPLFKDFTFDRNPSGEAKEEKKPEKNTSEDIEEVTEFKNEILDEDTTFSEDYIKIEFESDNPILEEGVIEHDLKVISRGFHTKIILVYNSKDGVLYSKKVMRKDRLIQENHDENRMESREERFFREIEMMKSYNHPHIVTLRKITQTPSRLNLFFDFVPETDLFFTLREEFSFSLEKVKVYSSQIASVVGYLHTKDLMARLISPENFVMDEFGGLVFVSIPMKHSFEAGSPEYLSPELCLGEKYGKHVDWWCVGLIIYEMSFGITPFYSENMNEMYELIIEKPLSFPPKMPKKFVGGNLSQFEDLKDLITKLLDREPEKRLGSKNDLDDIKKHPFFKGVDWGRLERHKRNDVEDIDERERVEYLLENFTRDGNLGDPKMKYTKTSMLNIHLSKCLSMLI